MPGRGVSGRPCRQSRRGRLKQRLTWSACGRRRRQASGPPARHPPPDRPTYRRSASDRRELTSPEMSQIPSLPCLFCQHLNRSDADYCRHCGEQLNLRPCERCDAVNLRTAKSCYRCGAEFPADAASGRGFLLTPTMADHALTAPRSADPGVAGPAVVRRGTPGAARAIVLLLVASAVAAYWYRGHLAPPGPTQGQHQIPMAGMDATSTTPGTMPPPPAGVQDTAGSPSPASSGADATLAARPLPTTEVDIKTVESPAVVEKCAPAVATLGLCDPETR